MTIVNYAHTKQKGFLRFAVSLLGFVSFSKLVRCHLQFQAFGCGLRLKAHKG